MKLMTARRRSRDRRCEVDRIVEEDNQMDNSGRVPAENFQHQPVMLDEVLESLSDIPEGAILDATVGGAGHAAALMAAHPGSNLIGIDRDPAALAAAALLLCFDSYARPGSMCKLRGESLNYLGKRHHTRIMCDAYGKGIVRGQAENVQHQQHTFVCGTHPGDSFLRRHLRRRLCRPFRCNGDIGGSVRWADGWADGRNAAWHSRGQPCRLRRVVHLYARRSRTYVVMTYIVMVYIVMAVPTCS